MRKIILALSLCLSACATVPVGPVAVANQTAIDEQVGITAELEYKTFRLAVETAVNAGIVKPGSDKAHKLAAIDNQLYSAVLLVRSAYAAANSSNYLAAISQANALLTTGYNLLRSK